MSESQQQQQHHHNQQSQQQQQQGISLIKKSEICLLILKYLKDERFSESYDVFMRESQSVTRNLQKIANRGVKSLTTILNEYVVLKDTKRRNDSFVSTLLMNNRIGTSDPLFQTIQTTLTSLRTLLDDYGSFRQDLYSNNRSVVTTTNTSATVPASLSTTANTPTAIKTTGTLTTSIHKPPTSSQLQQQHNEIKKRKIEQQINVNSNNKITNSLNPHLPISQKTATSSTIRAVPITSSINNNINSSRSNNTIDLTLPSTTTTTTNNLAATNKNRITPPGGSSRRKNLTPKKLTRIGEKNMFEVNTNNNNNNISSSNNNNNSNNNNSSNSFADSILNNPHMAEKIADLINLGIQQHQQQHQQQQFSNNVNINNNNNSNLSGINTGDDIINNNNNSFNNNNNNTIEYSNGIGFGNPITDNKTMSEADTMGLLLADFGIDLSQISSDIASTIEADPEIGGFFQQQFYQQKVSHDEHMNIDFNTDYFESNQNQPPPNNINNNSVYIPTSPKRDPITYENDFIQLQTMTPGTGRRQTPIRNTQTTTSTTTTTTNTNIQQQLNNNDNNDNNQTNLQHSIYQAPTKQHRPLFQEDNEQHQTNEISTNITNTSTNNNTTDNVNKNRNQMNEEDARNIIPENIDEFLSTLNYSDD